MVLPFWHRLTWVVPDKIHGRKMVVVVVVVVVVAVAAAAVTLIKIS